MPPSAPLRLAVTAAENAAPMAPILLRGDAAGILAEAARIGYQAIELHVPDIWSFDAGALAALCEKSGVAVSALVSGQLFVRKGLSLSDPDATVRDKATEGLKLFIDAAATLGCGVVVGWVRGKVAADPKGLLSRQGESLRPIDAYARERNVPVYIEAINRYELDSLNTAREIVDFIQNHELSNTYVHLDTFHMNIEECSLEKAIRQCGPLLGYFHVADNTRRHPGCDSLDFESVFRTLRECGYAGYISVECLPLPDGAGAARRAYEYLTHRFIY